jgi:hypothetical protein
VNEERKKFGSVGEFFKELDLISNSTDKARKVIVQKLKKILADIRSAKRALKEEYGH